MKGIVITTGNEISIQDFTSPVDEPLHDVVGGYIEHVLPQLLPKNYCMIVNEDGHRLNLPLNSVGCVLYDSITHGWPILGDIVIMKDGWDEDGEWAIIGLAEEDINFLFPILSRLCEFAKEVPSA